jgi:glycosyltransferase involved in cell wall biosynthesis
MVLRAIESVRTQRSPADQIIVADDGRRAFELDEAAADITLVRTSGRAGPSAARNLGAEHSHGEFIAFLDDDDQSTPDYLLHVRKVIESARSRVDLIITRTARVKGKALVLASEMPDPSELRTSLLEANPGLGGSNIIVRRDFMGRIGGFDVRLPASNDRAFGIAVVDGGGRIATAREAVVIIDQHTGARISNGLRSVFRKLPFIVRYWREMSWSQRRANVKRLRWLAYKAVRDPMRGWMTQLRVFRARVRRVSARIFRLPRLRS